MPVIAYIVILHLISLMSVQSSTIKRDRDRSECRIPTQTKSVAVSANRSYHW
jgi:hypothetical protein